MHFRKIHHIAIIVSDYQVSRRFYVDTLGFRVIREIYRESRNSYKLDLAMGEDYVIELFSFPNPPARSSQPEACGLRHLAFEVDSVESVKQELESAGVPVEPVRIDETTSRKFTFFKDPDALPIEIDEV